MLLSEIIKVNNIDPKDATYISAFGLRKPNDAPDEKMPTTAPVSKSEFKILGSGVEAVVYKTKDDPNVIKLLRTTEVDADEFNVPYVAYVIETLHRANGNPYFPRISGIQRIKGDAVDFAALRNYIQPRIHHEPIELDIYAFKMERLLPVDSLGAEEIEAMISGSFDPEKLDRDYGPDWRTEPAVGIQLIEELFYYMMNDSDLLNDLAIYPEQLSDVLNTIKKIGDGAAYDLHDENFMARRTPTGYQIVITDPVI